MTNLKAPTPVGPYSMFRYLGDNSDSALKKGPKQYWVMAGSIPIDPESGELNNDTIEDEVNQVFNNIEAVLALCKKYKLWLIEDTCDALGAKYDNRLLMLFLRIIDINNYRFFNTSL